MPAAELKPGERYFVRAYPYGGDEEIAGRIVIYQRSWSDLFAVVELADGGERLCWKDSLEPAEESA